MALSLTATPMISRELPAAIANPARSTWPRTATGEDRIVFCQNTNRPRQAEHATSTSWATFQGRLANGRRDYFVSFAPAVQCQASKRRPARGSEYGTSMVHRTDLSILAKEIDQSSQCPG